MSVFTVLQDIVNTFVIDSRTTVEIEGPKSVKIHTDSKSISVTVGSRVDKVKVDTTEISKEVPKQDAIDIIQAEIEN